MQKVWQRGGFSVLYGPFYEPEEYLIDDPIVMIPEIIPLSDRQTYEFKSQAQRAVSSVAQTKRPEKQVQLDGSFRAVPQLVFVELMPRLADRSVLPPCIVIQSFAGYGDPVTGRKNKADIVIILPVYPVFGKLPFPAGLGAEQDTPHIIYRPLLQDLHARVYAGWL